MIEVPIGVFYGEIVDVPVGEGMLSHDKTISNKRAEFFLNILENNDSQIYVFFTDKEGLMEFNFKDGYEDHRLHNFSYMNNGKINQYCFGDTILSDADPIFYRKITMLTRDNDERYKFFSNKQNSTNREFFNARKQPLGKFVKILDEEDKLGRLYKFDDNSDDGRTANSEEKIFYKDSLVASGGRRRKTKRKNSKRRRTNKKSKSRF